MSWRSSGDSNRLLRRMIMLGLGRVRMRMRMLGWRWMGECVEADGRGSRVGFEGDYLIYVLCRACCYDRAEHIVDGTQDSPRSMLILVLCCDVLEGRTKPAKDPSLDESSKRSIWCSWHLSLL